MYIIFSKQRCNDKKKDTRKTSYNIVYTCPSIIWKTVFIYRMYRNTIMNTEYLRTTTNKQKLPIYSVHRLDVGIPKIMSVP